MTAWPTPTCSAPPTKICSRGPRRQGQHAGRRVLHAVGADCRSSGFRRYGDTRARNWRGVEDGSLPKRSEPHARGALLARRPCSVATKFSGGGCFRVLARQRANTGRTLTPPRRERRLPPDAPCEHSAREAPRTSGCLAEYCVAPITPSRRRESSAQEARRQEAHHDAIQDAARASARAFDDSVDEAAHPGSIGSTQGACSS